MTFELGEATEANVILGIDLAVKRFKKGEISRLVIAPQYAFGKEGNPDLKIPPDAEVTYTVELKNFEKVKYMLIF